MHRFIYFVSSFARVYSVKRLLELCVHAGVGDTLLQSWDGMSAKSARDLPSAQTILRGATLSCVDGPPEVPSLQAFLEYPTMTPHVLTLLRDVSISYPIHIGSQMKMNLFHRGVPLGCEGRDYTVTFRATKHFHGKPWYDTMRYCYAMPNANDTLAYGRCVCFVEDAGGRFFVILRCYNPYIREVANGGAAPRSHRVEHLDREVQLVPLHLAEENDVVSYMLVAEESIINGGFILQDPSVLNKHWVVQGVRECRAYLEHNQ
jgi:hypothetical protein